MAIAYAACQLRTYGATRLPSYTATRIGKQRGARNGTPRHSWSLLLFSNEELLNLFLILLIFLFTQILARPLSSFGAIASLRHAATPVTGYTPTSQPLLFGSRLQRYNAT